MILHTRSISADGIIEAEPGNAYPVRVNKLTLKIGCTILQLADVREIFRSKKSRGTIPCGCDWCAANGEVSRFKFWFRKNGDLLWKSYFIIPAAEIKKLKRLLRVK